MTKMKTLMKGLLGASVFSLMAASNAYAAPLELTPAGTNVKNTFSLTYDVETVAQPPITTCITGEVGCVTETSTNFLVDRLVDLTVTASDTTVAPGTVDAQLVYSVTNTGNDTQAYALTLADITGDSFDTSPVTLTYYIDDGDGIFNAADGTGTLGDATGTTNTTDLLADGIIWVVIEGDIAGTVVDGDTDGVTLIADSLIAGTTTPITGHTGTNDLGVVETYLGDTNGVTDAVNAGDHSATGTFLVAAASVTADKTVSVYLQDYVDLATCAGASTADTDALATPGSCIEYIITATNDSGATKDADNVDILDNLPQSLTFAGVTQAGFTTAGTLGALTPGTDCSPTPTTCQVTLTDAVLAPGATGTVTIRAWVN